MKNKNNQILDKLRNSLVCWVISRRSAKWIDFELAYWLQFVWINLSNRALQWRNGLFQEWLKELQRIKVWDVHQVSSILYTLSIPGKRWGKQLIYYLTMNTPAVSLVAICTVRGLPSTQVARLQSKHWSLTNEALTWECKEALSRLVKVNRASNSPLRGGGQGGHGGHYHRRTGFILWFAQLPNWADSMTKLWW